MTCAAANLLSFSPADCGQGNPTLCGRDHNPILILHVCPLTCCLTTSRRKLRSAYPCCPGCNSDPWSSAVKSEAQIPKLGRCKTIHRVTQKHSSRKQCCSSLRLQVFGRNARLRSGRVPRAALSSVRIGATSSRHYIQRLKYTSERHLHSRCICRRDYLVSDRMYASVTS